MTLVVSDISSLGIIMVGDSAVTRTRGEIKEVLSGARKIHYSPAANIGFATWGHANVADSMMDYWIAKFIQSDVQPSDSVEGVALKLVDQLNQILSNSGKPWSALTRGIHIAGYNGELPCLYHIHCGHENEPAHELRLYKDFPDNHNLSEEDFRHYLNHGFIHLRNGYHPLFAPLFDHILEYSKQLKTIFNITFPQQTLQSRFEFYKVLVRFVADTLAISGQLKAVNVILSGIAFTEDTIAINEIIELQEPQSNETTGFNYYFNESFYPK